MAEYATASGSAEMEPRKIALPVAKRRSFAVSTGFRKDPHGPTRGDQLGDHRSVSSVQLHYF
jgi:hypothetical protein